MLAVFVVTAVSRSVSGAEFVTRMPPPFELLAAPLLMVNPEIDTGDVALALISNIRKLLAELRCTVKLVEPAPTIAVGPDITGNTLARFIVPEVARTMASAPLPALQAPDTALLLAAVMASRSVQKVALESSEVVTVMVAACAACTVMIPQAASAAPAMSAMRRNRGRSDLQKQRAGDHEKFLN